MEKQQQIVSYIRLNYFKEWIQRIQGRNKHLIPSTVLHQIGLEFKKQNKPFDELTLDDVYSILKQLHLPIYYDETHSILKYFNPMAIPPFTPEFENTLLSMFKEIQEPFKLHCPKDRKSFLPYSYILYKLLQLLKREDCLKYIPIIRSTTKINECDFLWNLICKDLKWEFIETTIIL